MRMPGTLADFTNSAAVKTLVLTMMTCMITGCTASVYPLLTNDDLVEDMDLSGEWELKLVGANKQKQKQTVGLKMEMYDTSTYDVSIIQDPSNDETQRKRAGIEWRDAWTLQIGKVDGHLFAQMIPQDPYMGPPLIKGIPVYVFGRLEVEDGIVKFYQVLDTSAAAIADREKLQHMTYKPSEFVELTVFTMPTADLQKHVVKHREKLFNPQPAILLRRSTSSK